MGAQAPSSSSGIAEIGPRVAAARLGESFTDGTPLRLVSIGPLWMTFPVSRGWSDAEKHFASHAFLFREPKLTTKRQAGRTNFARELRGFNFAAPSSFAMSGQCCFRHRGFPLVSVALTLTFDRGEVAQQAVEPVLACDVPYRCCCHARRQHETLSVADREVREPRWHVPSKCCVFASSR